MSESLSTDDESYFKRGARIKPARRRQLTEVMIVTSPRLAPDPTAYALAMENVHKPWARRWIKSQGYFL